jgi:hypothetical protein
MNYAISEAVSLAQLLVWEYSRMRGRAFAHNYRGRTLKYRDHARYAKFSKHLLGGFHLPL